MFAGDNQEVRRMSEELNPEQKLKQESQVQHSCKAKAQFSLPAIFACPGRFSRIRVALAATSALFHPSLLFTCMPFQIHPAQCHLPYPTVTLFPAILMLFTESYQVFSQHLAVLLVHAISVLTHPSPEAALHGCLAPCPAGCFPLHAPV